MRERLVRPRLLGAVVFACVLVGGLAAFFAFAPAAWLGRSDPRRRLSDPATFTPLRREPLTFAEACAPGDVVTLGFFGDLLVHNGPHRQALRDGFASLWAPIAPLLAAPDVTYGNLEGTLSRSAKKSSTRGGNRMVYNPALAPALVAAGVDVVSTANNHGLDNFAAGVTETLDVLDAAGLRHTGTRRAPGEPWFTLTTVRGLRIAWVACAEWTNERDPRGQLLHCHRQRAEVLGLVRSLAARDDVDLVVATPHGGREGVPRADVITRALQKDLVDAGALIVVGNHPHAVQQWEKRTAPDGREAFVSSCTGASFTALKKKGATRAGAFLVVGVARGADGRVRVRGARHVPLEWSRSDGRFTMKPAGDAVKRRVFALLSSWNEQPADGPLDVVPQCRAPDAPRVWQRGRAGEACDRDAECEAGLRCVVDEPDGVCRAR